MTRPSQKSPRFSKPIQRSAAFRRARRRTWTRRTITAVVLASFALTLWHLANQRAVKLRKDQPVSVLMTVAPPPPPPPPPPPEIPKPVVHEEIPEPTAVPEPAKAPDPPQANDAITQNADAQEGSDAFQIGAGDGTGQRGAGLAGIGPANDFTRGAYASYLAQAIRALVQEESGLRSKPFRVNVSVWLSAVGKVIRAELRSSTGSTAGDRELSALLVSLPALDQPPPQSVLDALPVQMTIDLRRSN